MLIVTINAIFGAGCLFFAQRAARRGWPFLRTGWMAVQSNASQPDFRVNVFRRRAISEGGRFLIGGLLWLAAALVGFLLALYFTRLAWIGMFG
ncbi:MAG: hypothetical protein R3E39_14965 [Anaerolineae bacterium]